MAQTILTRFHGPTNTRGSLVTAKCWGGKKTVPYNYKLNADANHKAAADALITDLKERTGIDWTIVAYGCVPDDTGYAFIIQ